LSINIWIYYKIFKGIKHFYEYCVLHNDALNLRKYELLKKILMIFGAVITIWLIFKMFIISNNDYFWYLKWMEDYIMEYTNLFALLAIFYVLLPNLEIRKTNDFQEQIDEETVNNTKNMNSLRDKI